MTTKNLTKPLHNQSWQTKQDELVDKFNLLKDTNVFIYDLHSKEYIIFDLVPETIADNYTPNINTQSNIFGRSTPIYFYSGSGDKTLSFTFSIHEDLLPKHKNSQNTSRNINDFLEILKDFSRAKIDKSGNYNTLVGPKVFMQIGQQFSGVGFIETSWSYKTPFRNDRYIYVDINLTFTYNITYEQPKISPLEIETFDGINKYALQFQDFDRQFRSDLASKIQDRWVDSSNEVTINRLINLMPTYTDYNYLQTYVYEEIKNNKYEMYNSAAVTGLEEIFYSTEQVDNIFRMYEYNLAILEGLYRHPIYTLIETYYIDLVIINSPDFVNLYNKGKINFNNMEPRLKALEALDKKAKKLLDFVYRMKADHNLQGMQIATVIGNSIFVRVTPDEIDKQILPKVNKLLEIIQVQRLAYSTVVGINK